MQLMCHVCVLAVLHRLMSTCTNVCNSPQLCRCVHKLKHTHTHAHTHTHEYIYANMHSATRMSRRHLQSCDAQHLYHTLHALHTAPCISNVHHIYLSAQRFTSQAAGSQPLSSKHASMQQQRPRSPSPPTVPYPEERLLEDTLRCLSLPTPQITPPHPADHSRKIDAISAALGARRAHVASLVRQQPELASFPVEILAARVHRLADILAVPPIQALIMAAQNPGVVAANPAEIRRKAARLAAALGLPAEQGMFLAARQPALLEYAPDSVASDCARLGASLGASPRGVLQLLARVGTRELRMLLGASGGMLREQLIDVLEALGLPNSSTRELDTLRMVAKNPGLLCARPARVAESCEALVNVFQAAPATFVHVLNRCPSLLTQDAADILHNYRGLGRLLGLPPAALARLLAAQPRLLRCRPEDVQSKLEALIYDMYMPREQVGTRVEGYRVEDLTLEP